VSQFKKLLFLVKEVVESDFSVDEPTPEVFRAFYSCADYFLSRGWRDVDWNPNLMNRLLIDLQKVLDHVPPEIYGKELPLVKKILWFCDDALKEGVGDSSEALSEFHAFVLDFRRNHNYAFSTKKWNIFDEVQIDLIDNLDANQGADYANEQLEAELLSCNPDELKSKFDQILSGLSEEQEYKDFGEVLWRFFQEEYFHGESLSGRLEIWLEAVRHVSFQTVDKDLLFQILGFLPAILEQEYSMPFRSRKKDHFKPLFEHARELLLQLQIGSEFGRELEQLVRQYRKFFFYFLTREKYSAFDECCSLFFPLMEKDFVAHSSKTFASEISEVYYALTSHSRQRYRICILKHLHESLKYGDCFQELFPGHQQLEMVLTLDALVDEVLREAFKDGELDNREREILRELFAFLKIEKKDALARMSKIQKEVASSGVGEGSLDSRSLMRRLLSLALQDGEIDKSERILLNSIGRIMGLDKVAMRELFFQAKEGVGSSQEPQLISAFSLDPDFNRFYQRFKMEANHLEELRRDLQQLLGKDQLVLEGDEIEWGELYPVPMNVELTVLPDIEQVGLLFFVDRKGILLLREVLQTLQYVLIEEGEKDSKIHLLLSGNREILVNQKGQALHYDCKIKEALSNYNGRISLLLVDQKSSEIVSHFDSGCGVTPLAEFKDLRNALKSGNLKLLKIKVQKALKGSPWDRSARNFLVQGWLSSQTAVNELHQLEKMAGEVDENDPGDFQFYNSYGKALKLAGRRKEAVAQWKKAIAVNPRYFPSLFEISRTLLEMGEDLGVHYLRQLQVYYWNEESVQSYIKAMTPELRSQTWANLCKTPFRLG